MVRTTKTTIPKSVAVGERPKTTKELRQRIVSAWNEQCKIASENDWCDNGTNDLLDLGLIGKKVFNIVASFQIMAISEKAATDIVSSVLEGNYYLTKVPLDAETPIIKVSSDSGDDDSLLIDETPLDEVIATIHTLAKTRMSYSYDSPGLVEAITNTLNAAGIPILGKKQRTYTITVSGNSDLSPAELLSELRAGYGFNSVGIGSLEIEVKAE